MTRYDERYDEFGYEREDYDGTVQLNEYLTPREVMELLAIGKNTFYKMVQGAVKIWTLSGRENGTSYYCNLASPYYLDSEALKYIDYDLDVKVFADGEKRLLDVEEYERHKKKMNYSSDLDYILKENVKILVDWINQERGPFSQAYVNIWYKRYIELKNR